MLSCFKGAGGGVNCSLREEEVLVAVGAQEEHEIGLLLDGSGEIGGV